MSDKLGQRSLETFVMEDPNSNERESKLAQRARKRLERERQSNEKRRLERIKDKERKKLQRANLNPNKKMLLKERDRKRKMVSRPISATYEDDYPQCAGEEWAKKSIKEMNSQEKAAYETFRKKEQRKYLTEKEKDLVRGKDKERKRKSKQSKQAEEVNTDISDDSAEEFEDREATSSQTNKRDIKNMNDEERKVYQKERKKKSRQILKKPSTKMQNPRWLQLQKAKERCIGKKLKIVQEKLRKDDDDAGRIQLFGKMYKKDDFKINGKNLEVDGFFPQVKFDLKMIERSCKQHTQLINLLESLGHEAIMSSDDEN